MKISIWQKSASWFLRNVRPIAQWFAAKWRSIARWVGIASFAALLIIVGMSFVEATRSAWRSEAPSDTQCSLQVDDNSPFSYIQYNIKDQGIEPFFNSNMLINVGEASGPSVLDVTTSGKGPYAATHTRGELFRDEFSKQFWMRGESTGVPLYRDSGSARDFPFDSSTISFDITTNPAQNFMVLILRNRNNSFYIPCETASAKRDSSGTIHVIFEMRRNGLVKLMAVVMLIAAVLFVLIIPFAVKPDAMATSVASFFFSIWSIRGILSPEIKVFPTVLDLIILALCVVLILLIGLRFLIRFVKSTRHKSARRATA